MPRFLAPPLFAAFILLTAAFPLPASAALLTPLVPTQCNCPSSAPDYGCVLQVLQNAMNDAIGFGTLFVVLVIAYSGFLFMTTGGSAENRTRARTLFTNAIVGLLLMFSAWLIVDFVMKTLYNSSSYGPWNTILAPDSTTSACIKQGATKSLTDGGVVGTIGSILNAGNSYSTTQGLATTGTGSCSAVEVSQGAASGGYAISDQEAGILSCIARYESGCGANNINYNWGKGSSAAGPFQILLGNNGAAFDNNACDAAVGLAPGTPLNCKSGFSGGNPIAGSPIPAQCVKAAENVACSSAAAAKLLGNATHATWQQAYGTSANDMGCVAQYGG